MSDTVVLDPELVAGVRRDLHAMALKYPNSIAGDILPESFDEAAAGTAACLDTEYPDRDTALWAALAKWKAAKNSHHFVRRRFRSANWNAF
ncbi:MAG TPA: hypothetical protein VGH02_11710 [Rhizomicrobium sp.]